MSRVVITALLFGFLLLFTSCATERSGIDVGVSECCVGAAMPLAATPDSATTFTVVAKDIPAFLGPLMVSNFSVALSHHGLQPVTENPDLQVTLSYVQENLRLPRERDDFEERIANGESMRFAARIVIDIVDVASNQQVWAGHIQRTHDVGPGEWMHTGRASVAIYDSFVAVLENFSQQEPEK